MAERDGIAGEERSLMKSGRVVIEHIRPRVDGGEHVPKATAGLPVEVSADVFVDGFDHLMAWVAYGPEGDRDGRHELAMAPREPSGDRWHAWITPSSIGRWGYRVVALRDEYGTWLHNLRLRAEDGQDVEVEMVVGALMSERRAAAAGTSAGDAAELTALAAALRRAQTAVADRIRKAEAPSVTDLMRRTADRSAATVAGPFPLWVDREAAGFSAWYELFPRSEGARDGRSGTFATAAERLPAVAAMGFDTVYLPPIHPIGTTARRGRNNTDNPPPGEPGCPWAIGAPAGGHTAVHPELGTIDDFDDFVAAARKAGVEVALDYALQCSPDHPWVTEHPEWFRHRPDGSIRYAENPPKRYFDIFPLDFDTPHRQELWQALRDVMLFWIGHGVRAFRVDNPHTKPFAFWQWLIEEVHRDHPDVIFLAEAFTRDTVRYRLSKVGFTQSYTDFTWRVTKQELTDYLTELSTGDQPDWFRPNFWVNTPDILHPSLHGAPSSAFRLRMILAAITGPSWGMYSGYELCENQPVHEGSEEYLDSEKYELKPRDWTAADSLAPLATRVNRIRHAHREAIALLRTLTIHDIDNDRMLCVSRSSADHSDVLLMILNLDPESAQSGTVNLDLRALGLDDARSFDVHDELGDTTSRWEGASHRVSLDPAHRPGHIFQLRG